MIALFTKFRKKESPVLRKKKIPRRLTTLQFQIVIGIALSIIIGLLITGIYFGTRIDTLQIGNVDVVGGQTIAHARITEAVERELSGAYLKLVPKRFIPLYPKSKVEGAVRSLERVKNVHVEITEHRTLTVVFDEYVPYALWCEYADSEACLFIDSSGFAFAQAPSLEGSAFVRYVEQDKVPQRDTVSFDALFIEETANFVELLKEQLSLYVTHVAKVGTYDIEYTIAGGGVIKVSQTLPMEESYQNLQTILTSEEFMNIEPGSFQYIDLRFGDKIFVNEELPNMEVGTTTGTTSVEEVQ